MKEEISELLERAQDYRKGLENSILTFNEFATIDSKEIEETLKKNVDNKSNICMEYYITKEEANAGCTKEIQYNRVNAKGQEERRTISLKIPKGMQDNTSILIYNEGSYEEKIQNNSNIKINIKIK